MSSPFPALDPFMELQDRWQSLHGWFIRKLAEQTMPKAEALGCWIDVERVVYQPDPEGEFFCLGVPDDYVAERTFAESGVGGTVALAQPKAVHELEYDPEDPAAFRQDYLVVRDAENYRRVLAVVEVLSPANKSGSYKPRYREKRASYMSSKAHFMEMDFLRGGENPARKLFPELAPTPYFIYVARKRPMGRCDEGYPIRLQDPLPVIGLPIGPPRPDLALDLPAAYEAAHKLTAGARDVRYSQEAVPPPALTSEDAARVREIVGATRKS